MLCRLVFICSSLLYVISLKPYIPTFNHVEQHKSLLCPPEKLLHLHHFIALAFSTKYLQSAVCSKISFASYS